MRIAIVGAGTIAKEHLTRSDSSTAAFSTSYASS